MLVSEMWEGGMALTWSEARWGAEDALHRLDDCAGRLNDLLVSWERHFDGRWSMVMGAVEFFLHVAIYEHISSWLSWPLYTLLHVLSVDIAC